MDKIASPEDLQAELRKLLAYAESEHPSREKLASGMKALADRVAGNKNLERALEHTRYKIPAKVGARVVTHNGGNLVGGERYYTAGREIIQIPEGVSGTVKKMSTSSSYGESDTVHFIIDFGRVAWQADTPKDRDAPTPLQHGDRVPLVHATDNDFEHMDHRGYPFSLKTR